MSQQNIQQLQWSRKQSRLAGGQAWAAGFGYIFTNVLLQWIAGRRHDFSVRWLSGVFWVGNLSALYSRNP